MLQPILFLISGILIGLIILGVFFFFFTKKISQNEEQKSQQKLDFLKMQMSDEFNKLSQSALKNANDHFLVLAKERLNAQTQESKVDLEGKKKVIENLVQEIRREILKSDEKLEKSDQERTASFSALKKELETNRQITGELRNSAEDLKKILSNNQMRGQFGEQVAENLLKMAGFVVGQDYLYNKEQESVDTRPDFTVLLPDQTKINIDVKFPYKALQKYTETDIKEEKEQYLRQFREDVKKKIKQVTTRDYINPEDKTVDFVILFIPNEMIFSFIYDQMNDIWEDAMNRKVVLAGPFSFTAILRMVKQAYSNFKYQQNLHHAISLIQKFEQEFQKYNNEFDKIGEKIDSCKKQYDLVATTRTHQLNKVVNQISNESLAEELRKDEEKKMLGE